MCPRYVQGQHCVQMKGCGGGWLLVTGCWALQTCPESLMSVSTNQSGAEGAMDQSETSEPLTSTISRAEWS